MALGAERAHADGPEAPAIVLLARRDPATGEAFDEAQLLALVPDADEYARTPDVILAELGAVAEMAEAEAAAMVSDHGGEVDVDLRERRFIAFASDEL